jgi:ParB family transcriptional regulator, chromosome partitioning protein
MNQEEIISIPISAIRISNPRSRNKLIFQGIISNISAVGLKRPVTVCRRVKDCDGTEYDLVCGQGRLEALIALGAKSIPAIITEASREQQLLMSLVENIARRPPSNRDLMREIKALRSRGYKTAEVASKLGLDRAYINGIIRLLDCGEDKLIEAVEARRLPLTVATAIANGTDEETRQALSEAYETGHLRGAKLAVVRRIIAQRLAKKRGTARVRASKRKLSADALVKEYQRHAEKNRAFIKKAATVNQHLTIITSALRRLLSDEHFVTLLRAESLNSMPDCLTHRLK